jgi:hypothetical protein
LVINHLYSLVAPVKSAQWYFSVISFLQELEFMAINAFGSQSTEKVKKCIGSLVAKINTCLKELGKDLKEDVIIPVGTFCLWSSIIILPIIFIALLYHYYSHTCERNWKNSKYAYVWDISDGCKIQTIDGGWVPEKNISVLPLRTF